jgi:protein gp37
VSWKSEIEWTGATWNPVRGCRKISPGCKHCYAEARAERFRGVRGSPYEQGFDPRLVPHLLSLPSRWMKSSLVFVNSMSDLFQDDVPDEYIEDVCRVMAACPWHIFQVLTKRAQRMYELLTGRLRWAANLPNVWWGVSVEDRRYGLPRVALLRKVPARIRFLSVEPLLEDVGQLDLDGIHWVIVGGESGPGARPMEEAWVTSIRDQCARTQVAFFFKQWGGVHKAKTGNLLEGRQYLAYPNFAFGPRPPEKERRSLVKLFEARAACWAERMGVSEQSQVA